MTQARSQLISLSDTPYYHITGRCVRRAFLCGYDAYSGKDFEHRRQWLIDHLALLANMFTIDVSAYTIMSNHYHLVLCVDKNQALELSNDEVARRWGMIFCIPKLVTQYLSGTTSNAESAMALLYIERWRERLYDISWFMRCFNEYIARKANKEDECTGHFWESRFKSQALLDETALLQCMAYVDLNPIRAQMAQIPETSMYTSIQQRLIELKLISPIEDISYTVPLMQFAETEHLNTRKKHIPFNTVDYLQLVDWLGRCVRDNKRGAIPDSLAPIFERLCICPDAFSKTMSEQRTTASAIGHHNAVQSYLENTNKKWQRNPPDWL